jgi:hypothetical protein
MPRRKTKTTAAEEITDVAAASTETATNGKVREPSTLFYVAYTVTDENKVDKIVGHYTSIHRLRKAIPPIKAALAVLGKPQNIKAWKCREVQDSVLFVE